MTYMKREADSGDESKAKRPRAAVCTAHSTSADEFDTHVALHRDKTCDKCIYE